MEEVENLGKLTIEKKGQQVECDILFIFENNDKKYVGYTDYSIEENERINIYVNTYNSLVDVKEISKITSRDEIEVIQKVLEKIASNTPSCNNEMRKIYQLMQENIEKYSSLSKKETTTKDDQIEEEKEELEENIKQARNKIPKELLEKLKEERELNIKVNKEFKLNIDIENTSKKQRQESINLLLSNTARRFILEKLAIDFINSLFKDYSHYILDEYWLNLFNKNIPT